MLGPWPAGELRPGLAVTYFYGRKAHVDDIEVLRNPVIDKSLENIAHRTIGGNVLASIQAMLVTSYSGTDPV